MVVCGFWGRLWFWGDMVKRCWEGGCKCLVLGFELLMSIKLMFRTSHLCAKGIMSIKLRGDLLFPESQFFEKISACMHCQNIIYIELKTQLDI